MVSRIFQCIGSCLICKKFCLKGGRNLKKGGGVMQKCGQGGAGGLLVNYFTVQFNHIYCVCGESKFPFITFWIFSRAMAQWLRRWILNPGVPCSKPLSGSKVDSAFHTSEVDKVPGISGDLVVKSKLPPRSGSSLEVVEPYL